MKYLKDTHTPSDARTGLSKLILRMF